MLIDTATVIWWIIGTYAVSTAFQIIHIRRASRRYRLEAAEERAKTKWDNPMIKYFGGWLYHDKATGVYSLETIFLGDFTGFSQEDVVDQAKAAYLKYYLALPPQRRERRNIDIKVEVPDTIDATDAK